MDLETLALFTAMEIVFCITPGPAVLLTMAYGFKGGFKAAFKAALGIEAGNTLYLAISAAGLGALVSASALAFTVVKWIGAGYLVFLGVKTILQAGKAADTDAAPRKPGRLDHPFVQALITQIANPKAILIFGALIPQFLNIHRPLAPQYAILWAVGGVIELSTLCVYGAVAAKGQGLIQPHMAVWRERISGSVLILVGTLFALVRRSVN
ncbi:MAG: homoserine/threonine efflux protein [Caulobacteraceae bacterium]|nr:homoserine/threonine efflux protein [Caulobacteraceae bacterium]